MNGVTFFIMLQLFILALLDVSAVKIPVLGTVGLAYWSLLWVTLIGFAIWCGMNALHIAVTRRHWMVLTVAILTLGTVIWSAGDARFLSDESTREIGCALKMAQTTPSALFSGLCHLGYPARQFLVPMLPSLIFGRHLWPLAIGNALYFLFGYGVFCYGILMTGKKRQIADVALALVLVAFAHFPIALSLLFSFEQAAYPMGLALFAAGLWLMWWDSRAPSYLLLLGLLQLAVISSYTPGLGLAFLQLILFGVVAWQWRRHHPKTSLVPLLLVAVTVISLIASFATRGDIRIVTTDKPDVLTLKNAWTVVTNVWHNLTQHAGAHPWTSAVFTLPFLGILLVGLTTLLGPVAALISAWIVLILFIAVFSHGYADGSIDYKLGRATIVIPFFLLLLLRTLERAHITIKVLLVLCCLLVVTGASEYAIIRHDRHDTGQVALAEWLSAALPPIPSTLMLSHELDSIMKADNFTDAAGYFLPEWNVRLANEKEGDACVFPPGYVVIATSSHCYAALSGAASGNSIVALTTFTQYPEHTVPYDAALLLLPSGHP
jgi:hypothetical protein